MRRGPTCSRWSNAGAVPILRLIPNEAAPRGGSGWRRPWRLDPVPGDSQPYGDARVIAIENTSLAAASLRVTSYARPGKLFTASRTLIVVQVASLKPQLLQHIVDSVVSLLRAGDSQ